MIGTDMPQDYQRSGVVIGRVAAASPGPIEEGVLVEAELTGQDLEMVSVGGGVSPVESHVALGMTRLTVDSALPSHVPFRERAQASAKAPLWKVSGMIG